MDPGLAFAAAPLPPRVEEQALVVPGSFHAWAVPMAALSNDTKVALAQRLDLPIGRRVQLLLQAGHTDEALALADQETQPLAFGQPMVPGLAKWAAEEQYRLGLPPAISGLIILAPGSASNPALVPCADGRVWDAATDAMRVVQQELPMLAWPRWVGPVVLILGNQPFPGLPEGDTSRPRCALPMLRVADPNRPKLKRLLTERFARLAIDRCVPPAQGWPTWLRRGLPSALAAYLDGSLPSADNLARRRSSAGSHAVEVAFDDTSEPDDLTIALAGPWLIQVRRQRLPAVMDALRAGESGSVAVHHLLGWSTADWTSARLPGNP